VRPELRTLKRRLLRLWIFSPERLWLLSISLERNGHWLAAFWLKQLNMFLYHNSLATRATVSPDVQLGHNGMGIVVSGNVEIGRKVKIWQNVTLTAGRLARDSQGSSAAANGQPRPKIILEDGVTIGANAVVVGPRGRTLRIGRGARIGAGTVVTHDVPAGARVVGAPVRVLTADGAPYVVAEEREQQ
jgi:serine O-acetyltransferase